MTTSGPGAARPRATRARICSTASGCAASGAASRRGAQLRTAHALLEAMGIEAFAERARRELLATGGTARQRFVDTSEELSPREAMIARLARDGLSNPEIGTRLFISARTVQDHLRKVFAKLAISSRSQLDRVLPSGPATAKPE